MPAQIVTNRQFCSPSAAAAPTVAAAGVAWTNTAAVELAATTDVTWILTGFNLWSNFNAAVTIDGEVDFLTGASLNVVIGTFPFRAKGGVLLFYDDIWFPIGIDNLNGRHGFRIRTSGTRTDTWSVKAKYYKNPINGLYQITRQLMRVTSPSAVPVTCTSGASAWQNGSAVTLMASAASDLVITHMLLGYASNSQMEVDLLVNSVAVYTFRLQLENLGAPYNFVLPNPFGNVAVGDLVQVRSRAKTGSSDVVAKATYFHKPL
jgi:hypothetical protein